MTRDPAFTSIETERLVLRRFERDDVEAFAAYRGDPDVARYQSWQDYTHAEAEALRRRRCWAPTRASPANGSSSRSPNARPAGCWATARWCSTPAIHPRPRSATPSTPVLAVAGSPPRPSDALIDYAFDRQGAARIRAVTDTRNAPSIAVAERLGMRRIATVRTTFKGAACDEHTYELRRDDRG